MRRPVDNSDKGDEKPKQKQKMFEVQHEFLHTKHTYEMAK